jgi:hypothetical protein
MLLQCEEYGNVGGVFEVDPQGSRGSTPLDPKNRYGRRTCMGQGEEAGGGGGNFESAAFDGRALDGVKCKAGDLDFCIVDFFVTHDAQQGEVRKYTPKASVVHDGYLSGNYLSILEDDAGDYSTCASKREGVMQYIKVTEGTISAGAGKFVWTTVKSEGRASARAYYPNNEGVDFKNGKLYIVSKTTKRLFVFDVDNFTWEMSSTLHGVFTGQPDQIKFITGDDNDDGTGGGGGLLYFTEDGGSECGVHAQTSEGQYLTIFESDGSYYTSETTGLSFSPDKKHMYCAFQGRGDVWDITREDALTFDGTFFDVKYHNTAATGITRRRRVRQLRG